MKTSKEIIVGIIILVAAVCLTVLPTCVRHSESTPVKVTEAVVKESPVVTPKPKSTDVPSHIVSKHHKAHRKHHSHKRHHSTKECAPQGDLGEEHC